MNPSSSNPEVREKTAVALQGQVDAAFAANAKGIVVHAGHCSGGTVEDGIAGWKEVLSKVNLTVPVLIENMAGGKASPGRTLESWDKLWNEVGSNPNIGVCLDSCHAYAAGLPISGLAQKMLAITGRIDLVHANGSKGIFGNGKDHHSNIYDSYIEVEEMIELIVTSDAPVILETPGGGQAQVKELELLRESVQSLFCSI